MSIKHMIIDDGIGENINSVSVYDNNNIHARRQPSIYQSSGLSDSSCVAILRLTRVTRVTRGVVMTTDLDVVSGSQLSSLSSDSISEKSENFVRFFCGGSNTRSDFLR